MCLFLLLVAYTYTILLGLSVEFFELHHTQADECSSGATMACETRGFIFEDPGWRLLGSSAQTVVVVVNADEQMCH
ncbi:hypothetical protein C8F01DRAFT_1111969, partial [Mycena amicta]